MCIEMNYKEIW